MARFRNVNRIGSARIGKQQHAQFKAGLVCCQLRVGEVPFALLLLQLRLDHVGVGCLACLLRVRSVNLVKSAASAWATFGDCEFVVGRGQSVIEAGHRRYQPATRDLQLRCGQRGCCIGARTAAYCPRPTFSLMTPWLAYSWTALLAMNLGDGCGRRPGRPDFTAHSAACREPGCDRRRSAAGPRARWSGPVGDRLSRPRRVRWAHYLSALDRLFQRDRDWLRVADAYCVPASPAVCAPAGTASPATKKYRATGRAHRPPAPRISLIITLQHTIGTLISPEPEHSLRAHAVPTGPRRHALMMFCMETTTVAGVKYPASG